MQKTCINRKGKQRKSSVRRGATENIDHKEQKGLLLLGIDLFTTCKYSPYTAYIRLRPYIRRIYIYIYIYISTVYIYIRYIYIYIYIYGWPNPCTVIRFRYGRKYPYTDTVVRRIQIRCIIVCTVLANPTVATQIPLAPACCVTLWLLCLWCDQASRGRLSSEA